jgi:signal transduction histidine kinase
MRRPSLFVRLMGSFALVILVGIVVVSVFANQVTTNDFRQFMFQGKMVRVQDLADQLGAYYRARGGWEGVDGLFVQSGLVDRWMGGMMDQNMMGATPSGHVVLADARGIVIADTLPGHVGEQATTLLLASGMPVRVNGQTVGTLVVEGDVMNSAFDAPAQEFLNRVNRSLLLAGLAAGIIALVLGFILFRQITAPLNTLADASEKIAAGDLTARAQVHGNDEIARVSRSFNAMAGNLARSESARRNMLADIAHELRNPIGVIQSHLEALMDGVFPMNVQQVASLHDETLLLSRLVGDLRELALADAGQLTLNRAPTDLAALVERTVAVFQPQANEQQIVLTTNLTNDLPTLNLDAQRIEQVLRNLLSNALRYTPAQGTVSVTLTRETNFARVEVRDTGTGIAPDALPQVFERFWRGDKSRSRAQGNTGLGLAITKQWVEAHGGQIGVESAVNEGTTFWFTLPG